jgi:hypothetical protein
MSPLVATAGLEEEEAVMKGTRQWRPQVELLDARELPSVMAAVPAAAPARLAPQSHPVRLAGTVHGTWSSDTPLPDVGSTQTLTGAGTVRPLGKVQAQGTVQTLGFIFMGRATGSFTLTNAQGSVTVHLVGPLQPGFSPAPATFHYSIVKGTGAFAGAVGSGRAFLHEIPAHGFTCPPGSYCPQILLAATFTLTFRPGPA